MLAVLVFPALGVVAGVEVSGLARLSASLGDAATALDQVGRSLSGLSQVPFAGPTIGPLADDIARTAESTRVNAAAATGGVRALAMVLGIAIAAIPLPLLLAGYLPWRLVRARQVRALRSAFDAGSRPDPLLVAHLAHAAVARPSCSRWRELGPDPWAELAAGRNERLAAVELKRLGVVVPPSWIGRPG